MDRIRTKEDLNYSFHRRIQEHEVVKALKKMDNGKIVELDNIPIEVWNSLGSKSVSLLTKLFNVTLRSKKMLDEWTTNYKESILFHARKVNHRGYISTKIDEEILEIS